MASKAKTRVKMANGGRNVVANFPIERLRVILPSLTEGDERTLLEQALASADAETLAIAREERLKTTLSIESLAPLGWMATGTVAPLAYGAIREGDFRSEGTAGWAYGPPGAFDREADDVVIMRGAVQAGVMSEEHCVYRLLEPTTDRQRAIADAMRLEAEWRRELPSKMRKPKALLAGGRYEHETKGMLYREQRRYMDACDLEGLPEGASISRGRGSYSPSSDHWRFTDIVHRDERGKGVVTVSAYACDATLRPVILCTGSGRGSYGSTGAYRWTAKRHVDPSFDSRHPAPPTSPYDCVLGNVWSVTHNGPVDWSRIPVEERVRIVIGSNSTAVDRHDHEVFPIATRAEADVAAMNFAIRLGMADGGTQPMPDTLPVPIMDDGVDMAQAA